jgi:isopentenyldiphosphate isomerase
MASHPAPNPSDERVIIVDEHNRVLGGAARARMRAENLRYRATYILVFNRAGDLYVQKRTMTKDMFPGYYDAAAGGVLMEGESYQESAAREVAEELGLNDVALDAHGDFYYEDARNRVWGRVYTCVHDGPFRLQAEEIESGRFVKVEDLLAGRLSPLTPDSVQALRLYLQRVGGRP